MEKLPGTPGSLHQYSIVVFVRNLVDVQQVAFVFVHPAEFPFHLIVQDKRFVIHFFEVIRHVFIADNPCLSGEVVDELSDNQPIGVETCIIADEAQDLSADQSGICKHFD